MKRELQTFSDGSEYFGDPRGKIIGPTPEDIEYFSSLEKTGKQLEKEGLVIVSRGSKLGEFLNFSLGKVPKPGIILPATVFLGLIVGACSGDGKDSAPTLPVIVDPHESPLGAPEILSEGRLLDLPFPPDPNMHIQQAWISNYNPNHHAMDIIKGNLDNSSTWKSFSILAGADGKACANPPSRQGNAVLIEHNFNGKTIFEYDGHLESIEPSIPDCGEKTKDVRRGEKVGMAGATGVVDEKGDPQPSWKHTHWRVFDANNNSIDPFDISGERQLYPNIDDPKYTNGKLCGSKTILMGCPTEITSTVSPKQPTPTPSRKQYPVVTPTPVKRTPTPVRQTNPVEKPTAVPKIPEPTYVIPIPPTPEPIPTYSLAAPKAPSNLTVVRLAPYKFRLTWQDNSDNEEKIWIDHSCYNPPPPNANIDKQGWLPPNTTSYDVIAHALGDAAKYGFDDSCLPPAGEDQGGKGIVCWAIEAENSAGISRSEWKCG